MTRARSVTIPRKLDASDNGLFFGLLKRDGLPLPETEVRFAAPRRWRFDYAWALHHFDHIERDVKGTITIRGAACGVALEVEGGAYTRGRHTRGKGFIADMAKYNEAAIRGWKVIRVTPSQLCTLDTIALIRRALSLPEPTS